MTAPSVGPRPWLLISPRALRREPPTDLTAPTFFMALTGSAYWELTLALLRVCMLGMVL